MNEDSSLAMNTAPAAISSGLPSRPNILLAASRAASREAKSRTLIALDYGLRRRGPLSMAPPLWEPSRAPTRLSMAPTSSFIYNLSLSTE
jgi:hypothetical protein